MNVSFEHRTHLQFRDFEFQNFDAEVAKLKKWLSNVRNNRIVDQLDFRQLDFNLIDAMDLDQEFYDLFLSRVWFVAHMSKCDGPMSHVFYHAWVRAKRISYSAPGSGSNQRCFYRQLCKALSSSTTTTTPTCVTEELCIRDLFDGSDVSTADGGDGYDQEDDSMDHVDYPTSINPLAAGIANNTSLDSLDFGGSAFCDEAAITAFADGIGANSSVTRLDLSQCKFHVRRATPIVHLFGALNRHPKIANIYLNGINLNEQIISKTIHKLVQGNHTLRHLNLTESSFWIMEDFVEALQQNTSVTSLVLSNNKMDDNEAALLSKVLETNSTLEWIDLRYNRIKDDGVRALASAIMKNPTSRLKEILLAGNVVTVPGMRALIDVVKTSTCTIQATGKGPSALKLLKKLWFLNNVNRVGGRLLKKKNKTPVQENNGMDHDDDGENLNQQQQQEEHHSEPTAKKRKIDNTTGGSRQDATSSVPIALWPLVLGKIRDQCKVTERSCYKTTDKWSNETQAGVMYYLLRESELFNKKSDFKPRIRLYRPPKQQLSKPPQQQQQQPEQPEQPPLEQPQPQVPQQPEQPQPEQPQQPPQQPPLEQPQPQVPQQPQPEQPQPQQSPEQPQLQQPKPLPQLQPEPEQPQLQPQLEQQQPQPQSQQPQPQLQPQLEQQQPQQQQLNEQELEHQEQERKQEQERGDEMKVDVSTTDYTILGAEI